MQTEDKSRRVAASSPEDLEVGLSGGLRGQVSIPKTPLRYVLRLPPNRSNVGIGVLNGPYIAE